MQSSSYLYSPPNPHASATYAGGSHSQQPWPALITERPPAHMIMSGGQWKGATAVRWSRSNPNNLVTGPGINDVFYIPPEIKQQAAALKNQGKQVFLGVPVNNPQKYIEWASSLAPDVTPMPSTRELPRVSTRHRSASMRAEQLRSMLPPDQPKFPVSTASIKPRATNTTSFPITRQATLDPNNMPIATPVPTRPRRTSLPFLASFTKQPPLSRRLDGTFNREPTMLEKLRSATLGNLGMAKKIPPSPTPSDIAFMNRTYRQRSGNPTPHVQTTNTSPVPPQQAPTIIDTRHTINELTSRGMASVLATQFLDELDSGRRRRFVRKLETLQRNGYQPEAMKEFIRHYGLGDVNQSMEFNRGVLDSFVSAVRSQYDGS